MSLVASGLCWLAGCGRPDSAPQTASINPEQASPADVAAVQHLYDDVKQGSKAAPESGARAKKSEQRRTAAAKSGADQVAGSKAGTNSAIQRGNGSRQPASAALNGGDALASLNGNGPPGIAKASALNPNIITASKSAPAPRKVQLLVKERKFAAEGAQGALRVLYEDLDLLRVINMDPVTADCDKHMPDWLKQLSGKKVRIRGFMAPTFTETDITNFVMARDTQACCFGPNVKIYHLIEVHMKSGLTADYLPFRPLEVVGTFRIEPSALEGAVFHLYFIDDAEIVAKK